MPILQTQRPPRIPGMHGLTIPDPIKRFYPNDFTAPNSPHRIHRNTQTSSFTENPKFECLRKRSPALENNANLCAIVPIRHINRSLFCLRCPNHSPIRHLLPQTTRSLHVLVVLRKTRFDKPLQLTGSMSL